MQQNLQHCLQLVLESEGGFVRDPRDPGGATNMGITLATLSAWRQSPVTVDDVKALGMTEACMIYRAQYASPIRFGDLPEGLDYAVLDAAVNSGPSKAVRLLQAVVGVEQDGIIGLHTMAALQGRDAVEMINAYSQARLSFLRQLDTWRDFGRGWASRVARVESDAIEMATGIEHALRPELATGAEAKAPPAPPPSPSPWAALVRVIANIFGRE